MKDRLPSFAVLHIHKQCVAPHLEAILHLWSINNPECFIIVLGLGESLCVLLACAITVLVHPAMGEALLI